MGRSALRERDVYNQVAVSNSLDNDRTEMGV
jgi:hypothetical protein